MCTQILKLLLSVPNTDELLPFSHVTSPLDFLASIFLTQKYYPSSSLANSIQTLLLWAAIPALIPKAGNRRQVNSLLSRKKCLCIPWMIQTCSTVMTSTTEIFLVPAQETAKVSQKESSCCWASCSLSGRSSFQILDSMQNPVVMKWLNFWEKLFLFVCLLDQSKCLFNQCLLT